MTRPKVNKPPGVHSECGKAVLWVQRRVGGGWNPPVEPLGWAWGFDNGLNLVKVAIYRKHVCDPLDVMEYSKVKESKRRADKEKRSQPYEDLNVLLWKEALEIDCPKCPAKVGDKCINLNQYRFQKVVLTKWPHDERLPDPLKQKGAVTP